MAAVRTNEKQPLAEPGETRPPATNGHAQDFPIAPVKDYVRDTIYAHANPLVALAHDIHDHPELAFCEEYAANRLTEFLTRAGFEVRKGICGMPTAFVATIGHGPLHIAFCAEYDALPPSLIYDRSKPPSELAEIWLTPERQDAPLRHACGHHLIAGAAVAAALGLRDLAEAAGLTVSVFGTPAEEMYGEAEPRDGRVAPGKVVLLECGAFEGVHAVLMVHPFPTPFSTIIPSKASLRLRATFSTAGDGTPRVGAAELRQLEAALKQVIQDFHQIPGIFVARAEDGRGCAQADIFWIAPALAQMAEAREAMYRCFEATATAAGVCVHISAYAPGAEMRHDPFLSAAFIQNSKTLGRLRAHDEHFPSEIRQLFSDPRMPRMARLLARVSPRLVTPDGLFMDKFPAEIIYGTDLGNVSQVIPAIHPYIGVGGSSGPHMAEFADDADTDEAHRAMLDGGIALAWTALDAASDPTIKMYLLESATARARTTVQTA